MAATKAYLRFFHLFMRNVFIHENGAEIGKTLTNRLTGKLLASTVQISYLQFVAFKCRAGEL